MYCDYYECENPCKISKPCYDCKYVFFCSNDCRRKAFDLKSIYFNHELQCSIIQALPTCIKCNEKLCPCITFTFCDNCDEGFCCYCIKELSKKSKKKITCKCKNVVNIRTRYILKDLDKIITLFNNNKFIVQTSYWVCKILEENNLENDHIAVYIKALIISANCHNKYSLLLLGYYLLKGVYLDENKVEAFKVLKLAAKKHKFKNNSCNYNLGLCYMKGIGTNVDKLKAVQLLEKCDKYSPAYLLLYDYYKEQNDIPKILYWLNKGDSENCSEAQLLLYHLYTDGVKGIKKRKDKAVKYCRKASNNGSLEATKILAEMYKEGCNTIKYNPKKAFELYVKANDYVNISKLYYYGQGTPRDYNKAFETLVTNENTPETLYELGLMYYYGEGTPKNEDKGILLLKKSSELNYKQASLILSRFYYKRKDYLNFNKYFKDSIDDIIK